MIPPLIIQTALDMEINLLAITDHNATANISAVIEAATGSGIHIFPGMELQTHEEVHVLCLFDTLDQVQALQHEVDAAMPDLKNNANYFGEQFVVDATGDFIRREESMLITSSSLTIKQACAIVNRLGGLLIPAHVNRKAFGLLPTLGFIPEELSCNLVMEISRHLSPEKAYKEFPQLQGKVLIQSGDVHRLNEFLGVNYFTMNSPSISELEKAFSQTDGRNFKISLPNL